MVGIVIVSHMVSIADGVRDMASKIANPNLVIISAGGAADGSFGTDNVKICKAIQQADDGDGVVVVTDVGSSVISAGIAVQDLDMNLHRRVRIADAPIVEGAIAAASEASKNSSVDEVLQAAELAKSISKKS